ncbi:MAG TPA: TadE/TadG family type IV pilus assembly protein [Planctomycetaceae bacterium]|nr:TadE/TadG family type IV pilus assembly protein [Planctomycetaceae bacterium]
MQRAQFQTTAKSGQQRRGVTIVETALMMPVFVLFLASLMEFGHFFLVRHMTNAAARKAASYGCAEGVTNSQVIAKAQGVINAAYNANKATIIVKDASTFDTPNVNPTTLNYDSLPAITLSSAATSQFFLVQVKVAYKDVALLPPFWLSGATIIGRSVMRHE